VASEFTGAQLRQDEAADLTTARLPRRRESRDERLMREDGERKVWEAARAAFLKELPHKLLLLAARFGPFGEVKIRPNGDDGDDYTVEFHFYDNGGETSDRDDVSFGTKTEEWAIDGLRHQIESLELAARIRAEKREKARAAWTGLTEEQREAIANVGVSNLQQLVR
jgi:hypothetical protein